MALRGMCSRREADRYIEQGWVLVDGVRVMALGTKVRPDVEVVLDAPAQAAQADLVTILLHKPIGIVSSQPEPGYEPAIALISDKTRYRCDLSPRTFEAAHLRGLAVAGRLDIDSEGLLVLTQDGRIARQLIGEHSGVEKEYLVRVQGPLDEAGLRLLNHGLSLDGKPLRPAQVTWQNRDELKFILKQGKKRQIRRMCELVGLKVLRLKRVRVGNIRLGDLPYGQWRYLGAEEAF
ncbi:MAG: rRNA pseudouridine synthase [Candidatus Hydrogenedentes bacterium]|nr:rRNA pseudouridine synthase [Candidatus Hydrogenedentota bacterium]